MHITMKETLKRIGRWLHYYFGTWDELEAQAEREKEFEDRIIFSALEAEFNYKPGRD